jgi:hypothetical protein
MQPTDPATNLRLMIHALLLQKLITPALAEQALLDVKSLADQAALGQQLGALGVAATSPDLVVAPTLKVRPIVESKWGKHEHLSREGRPIARESAADRKARLQAASIGFENGRFVG